VAVTVSAFQLHNHVIEDRNEANEDDPPTPISAATLATVSSISRPSIVRRSQAVVARASVGHWLLITSIDLLLNAPDNVIRLLVIFGILCDGNRVGPIESKLLSIGNQFFNAGVRSDHTCNREGPSYIQAPPWSDPVCT
jgi:hypothetical protein